MREGELRYAILFYESIEDFDARKSPARHLYWQGWKAYASGLDQSGKLLSRTALQSPDTGATIDTGKVKDGAFAISKKQLGGVFIVEANHLDEALQLAARSPAANSGAIEVRPVIQMNQNKD